MASWLNVLVEHGIATVYSGESMAIKIQGFCVLKKKASIDHMGSQGNRVQTVTPLFQRKAQ